MHQIALTVVDARMSIRYPCPRRWTFTNEQAINPIAKIPWPVIPFFDVIASLIIAPATSQKLPEGFEPVFSQILKRRNVFDSAVKKRSDAGSETVTSDTQIG